MITKEDITIYRNRRQDLPYHTILTLIVNHKDVYYPMPMTSSLVPSVIDALSVTTPPAPPASPAPPVPESIETESLTSVATPVVNAPVVSTGKTYSSYKKNPYKKKKTVKVVNITKH
jgi:uncharacterized membrane protein